MSSLASVFALSNDAPQGPTWSLAGLAVILADSEEETIDGELDEHELDAALSIRSAIEAQVATARAELQAQQLERNAGDDDDHSPIDMDIAETLCLIGELEAALGALPA
jgi:hypothetical protein